MLKRKFKDDGNLEITINNLADINKVFADITDIYFGLKVLETDADDALFYKTVNTSPGPGGITTIPLENKVIIEWKATEYENLGTGNDQSLVIGEKYFLCFSALFNGETIQREIDIDHSKVEIEQDRVRR